MALAAMSATRRAPAPAVVARRVTTPRATRAAAVPPARVRCVRTSAAASAAKPKGARAKRFRDGRPRPARSSSSETSSSTVAVDDAAAATKPKTAAATHVCEECGYIYALETPFDALGADFECPQCRAPKDRFSEYVPPKPDAAAAAAKAKTNASDGMSAREIGTVTAFVALLGAAVASAGGPAGAAREVARAGELLVANHFPGVGGVVEDSFLGLLAACTVYSLWRSSLIPAPVGNPIARKSRTRASWLHVVSGGGALVTGLYGVALERVYRESPGWTWMWVSSALFLTNALTYSPLMQIFKASKEGKYAMKLGYSFVASFQGVVFIAWSAQPDAPAWMYWSVMPFWYFSIAKLWESTEFVLALTPESASGDSFQDMISAGSKRRLGKMTPDAATLTYVSLNAFAAIFDNCYMALYTALGPEAFWHTSRVFNDSDFHLRLVKGTTGSLTVALLIFISTLGWRKQMSMDLAIWLNVILGSVGPWIVLFWHKLEDPTEDWFPQFVFDPGYDYHPLWQTASAVGDSVSGLIGS